MRPEPGVGLELAAQQPLAREMRQSRRFELFFVYMCLCSFFGLSVQTRQRRRGILRIGFLNTETRRRG